MARFSARVRIAETGEEEDIIMLIDDTDADPFDAVPETLLSRLPKADFEVISIARADDPDDIPDTPAA